MSPAVLRAISEGLIAAGEAMIASLDGAAEPQACDHPPEKVRPPSEFGQPFRCACGAEFDHDPNEE